MFLGNSGVVLKREKAGGFRITEHTVHSEKLPQEFDGFKIVHISDLHSARFGANNEKLAREINALKPDLTVFTGDMLTVCHPDFSVFLGLLEHLDSGLKKLMILGNHEQRLDGVSLYKFCGEIERKGVRILRNETEQIERNGKKISVIGLELPLEYYRRVYQIRAEKKTLENTDTDVFIGKKPDDFTVLLSHNPLYFDGYAEWGAELTFSGHVHGGIVEIPKIGGLLSPERKFFPHYCSGMYKKDDSFMIVSRGLCSGQPLIRCFNPREVVVAVLKCKV